MDIELNTEDTKVHVERQSQTVVLTLEESNGLYSTARLTLPLPVGVARDIYIALGEVFGASQEAAE